MGSQPTDPQQPNEPMVLFPGQTRAQTQLKGRRLGRPNRALAAEVLQAMR